MNIKKFIIIVLILTLFLVGILSCRIKELIKIECIISEIQGEYDILKNNNDTQKNKDINILSENETIEISNDNNIEQTYNIENKKLQSINKTSIFDKNAFIDGHLKIYPYYGEKYATLKINKIEVDAPIYFGVTSDIISKGVGHDSGSYFAGESGTIIMCEHNYMNNFRRLGELVNGDIIEIQTNYGDFYYKLYDKQVIEETETYKLPIQHNQEKLIIYTCYPFNNTGYTTYRYVIYANKI